MLEHVKTLLEAVNARLHAGDLRDTVTSKPLSMGDRHVLILSEFSVGFGAGGGLGESREKGSAKGLGGGGGGGAKASPVAVLVVEQGKIRLEKIGN
jgi:uncharacterized spore protein YtfJ